MSKDLVIKMNLSKIINNFEKYTLIFCISCFLYGWGIKYDFLQLRLFIFLPLIIIFYQTYKNKNLKFLILPFYFFLFLIIHLLVSSYLSGYSDLAPIKYILAATLISIVISYYYQLILDNLYLITKIFLILIIPIFLINMYLAINYSIKDDSLVLNQLFFNCDNSVINFGEFIFKENSHFALIATPILMSYIFIEKKLLNNLTIFLFIIFILINVTFFSTTMLVSIIFCSLVFVFYFLSLAAIKIKNKKYSINKYLFFSKQISFFEFFFKKSKYIFLIIIIPIIFTGLPTCEKKIMETLYLITKVETSDKYPDEKDVVDIMKKYRSPLDTVNKFMEESVMPTHEKYFNASASTYYYSLLVTLESFKKFPLGLGFNNYEKGFNYAAPILKWFVDKDESNKRIIHDYAASVNQKDGYNNLAKLTVEFGIIGFLLTPIFLMFLFNNRLTLFQKFFISSLILTQLLKGVGYFNGGFILGIFIMLVTVFNNNHKTLNE